MSTISVVVPAHEEHEAVGGVVAAVIESCPEALEVLVVDDGSTDGTGEAAAKAGARVLRLSPNRGKGHALRAGIEAARGDVLVFIDADGQDDPREMPRLLAALEPGVDMVIGSRFAGTLLDGSITRLNYAGNHGLTWFFNRLHGTALTDTQAGFRVVRRSALRLHELRASRYEIETELTMHVLRGGGRIVEVPVTRDRRSGGASGFKVARDGLRILLRMVAGRLAPGGRCCGAPL
jgi:glycosyltransferase involved in cell wall biosynthesis